MPLEVTKRWQEAGSLVQQQIGPKKKELEEKNILERNAS